jgi:uncharacterized Zn finger protein (UPF0148 family)
MLKGWTLTDVHCPHCNTTPLMREPTRQAVAEGRTESQKIEFCARCQGAPGGVIRASEPPRQVNGMTNGINGHVSDSSDEEESDHEIDAELEAELASYVPPSYIPTAPAPTPSSFRTPQPSNDARRQQSDYAVDRIGSLLLQGYTLLSTLCSTPSCYAIPLVGHPRRRTPGESGNARPGVRKECVVCGKIWEADGSVYREALADRQTAAVTAPSSTPIPPARQAEQVRAGPRSGGPTIRDITREEAMRIYSGEIPSFGDGEGQVQDSEAPRIPQRSTSLSEDVEEPSIARRMDQFVQEKESFGQDTSSSSNGKKRLREETSSSSMSKVHQTLDATEKALLATLSRLNSQLETKVSSSNAEFMDFVHMDKIAKHLSSTQKVMEALEVAKRVKMQYQHVE